MEAPRAIILRGASLGLAADFTLVGVADVETSEDEVDFDVVDAALVVSDVEDDDVVEAEVDVGSSTPTAVAAVLVATKIVDVGEETGANCSLDLDPSDELPA